MNDKLNIVGAIAGTIGAVLTVLAFGYSFGRDSKDDLVQFLESQLEVLTQSNERLSLQNESLRARALAVDSGSVEVIQPLGYGDTGSDSNALAEETPPAQPAIDSQTIKISRQQTASFFNGELEISTVSSDFSGSPLRNRITFSVLIPGESPNVFELVDSGFTTTIDAYQILVTETDTFSATYKVFKLD